MCELLPSLGTPRLPFQLEPMNIVCALRRITVLISLPQSISGGDASHISLCELEIQIPLV